MASATKQQVDDKMILPVLNGQIDLVHGALIEDGAFSVTGEQLDVAFNPEADQSVWVDFLKSILPDHAGEEAVDFLQRSFGCALTGGAGVGHYIWVFSGTGSNGGRVLFRLISDVLGPFCHQVDTSMLIQRKLPRLPKALDQHFKSLRGKRLLLGCDIPGEARLDAKMIKDLSAANPIVYAPLYSDEPISIPTLPLMLLVNDAPSIIVEDRELPGRVIPVALPYSFVDDVDDHKKRYPQDAHRFRQGNRNLVRELRKNKEGILAWLVDGCRRYLQEGLEPQLSFLQSLREQQI